GVDELVRASLKINVFKDLSEVLQTGLATSMRPLPHRIIRSIPPDGVRAGQLDQCVEIAAIDSVKAQTYKLHVLLRHRLLLHRVEGFAQVAVLAKFGDLSFAQPEHGDLMLLEQRPACAPATNEPSWDNDVVSRVDERLRFDAKPGEVVEVPEVFYDRVMPAVHGCVGVIRSVRPLDVGI